MIYLFIQIAVAYVVLILLDLPAVFASIDHRLLFDCLEQLVGLPGSVSRGLLRIFLNVLVLWLSIVLTPTFPLRQMCHKIVSHPLCFLVSLVIP